MSALSSHLRSPDTGFHLVDPPAAILNIHPISASFMAVFSSLANRVSTVAWRALLLTLLTANSVYAQSISSISPTSGEPGNRVTISGSFFPGPGTTITVGFGTGNLLGDITSITSNQIEVNVPALAVTGLITVTHQFQIGTSIMSSSQTFTVAPRIDSFHKRGSPGVAVVDIGQELRIHGANFLAPNGITVRFNGSAASSVTITAASQLIATVASGTTTGPISITSIAGTFISSSNLVISGSAVITDFDPKIAVGGTKVRIDGGDFTGATQVAFNGKASPDWDITSVSQILATVPSEAGVGPITVVTPNGTATSFTDFIGTGAGPIITNIMPISGMTGDPIVISGFNLILVTNVLFNGVNALSNVVTSDTQLTAFVPPNVTSGPITVISEFGSTNSTQIFSAEPIITNFVPAFATVGTEITIRGLNLSEVTNVNFNGITADFTNTAPNQIHAYVPFGATNGPIQVITPSATNTTTTNFTVIFGEPVITSFSPSNGLAGTVVIITGQNFSGTTNVTFNGVDSPSVDITSDSQLRAVAPVTGTSGPLTVFGQIGTNQSINPFYFAPRLISFTPIKGPVGTTINVTGSSFIGTTRVELGPSINRVVATFREISDIQLDVDVPTNAVNGEIVITSPGGVVISTGIFTILPRIDTLNPLWGPVNTSVLLTGYSFTNIGNVMVNGIATDYFVDSLTQMRVEIPLTASTGPITIITTTGDIVSSPTDFIVTTTTDLGITHTPNPTLILPDTDFDLLISITNHGPSIATQVRVIHTLAPVFTVNSATSTLGSCSIDARIDVILVTCDIPSFTNGTAALITVNVHSPNTFGGFSSDVRIERLEPDPVSANNNHGLLLPIIAESDQLLSISRIPATNLIELRWPASAAIFKPQASPNLQSSGIQWETLTNQVFTIITNTGNYRVVTDSTDTTPTNRFYRLILE